MNNRPKKIDRKHRKLVAERAESLGKIVLEELHQASVKGRIADMLPLMRRLDIFDALEFAVAGSSLARSLEAATMLPAKTIAYAFKHEVPWHENRPYDGACDRMRSYDKKRGRVVIVRIDRAGRHLERRQQVLEELKCTCPLCGRMELNVRSWHVPLGSSARRDPPMCLRCYTARGANHVGRPSLGELPEGNVCPQCGKTKNNRRSWALRAEPIVCRLCHSMMNKVTSSGLQD